MVEVALYEVLLISLNFINLSKQKCKGLKLSGEQESLKRMLGNFFKLRVERVPKI